MRCWWVLLSLLSTSCGPKCENMFSINKCMIFSPLEVNAFSFDFVCQGFKMFITEISAATIIKWRLMELHLWCSQHCNILNSTTTLNYFLPKKQSQHRLMTVRSMDYPTTLQRTLWKNALQLNILNVIFQCCECSMQCH